MDYQDNLKLTYRRLRRIIGYLGISLPILLGLATMLDSYVSLQPSISHYYYTNMRDVFTGVLCAVGLFMIRYKGFGNKKFWLNDNLLTNLAGFMAFGVALIPTNPEPGIHKMFTLIPIDAPWLGALHYAFAGILFLMFSILSFFVFTLGQKRDPGVPVSFFDENHIYRACAVIIWICIVLIATSGRLFPGFSYATYVFETISLAAFGISWLIKGRALGDSGVVGRKLYGERNAQPSEETTSEPAPILQVP